MFKKLRKLAKEEPIWLSICLVAVTIVLTALNVLISIARIKGLM